MQVFWFQRIPCLERIVLRIDMCTNVWIQTEWFAVSELTNDSQHNLKLVLFQFHRRIFDLRCWFLMRSTRPHLQHH